jgi:hypothetical protein
MAGGYLLVKVALLTSPIPGAPLGAITLLVFGLVGMFIGGWQAWRRSLE